MEIYPYIVSTCFFLFIGSFFAPYLIEQWVELFDDLEYRQKRKEKDKK